MSWWESKVVYVTPSALLLTPPGRLVYHRQTRLGFPRYEPDPDHPESSRRVGKEKHRTACGLVTFDEERPSPFRMEAIRLDIGVLLGRPCRTCERRTRR